jgi:hypothetical protein
MDTPQGTFYRMFSLPLLWFSYSGQMSWLLGGYSFVKKMSVWLFASFL